MHERRIGMQAMTDDLAELSHLRHDHHGCALCKTQRAWAADEIERLRRWQAEANLVLEGWDRFADDALEAVAERDKLGKLKWIAVQEHINSLNERIFELEDELWNWVEMDGDG
jgi:hypothetical protein